MFIVQVLFLKLLIITVNYNSMGQYENGSLTFIIAWHLWNMSISISICLNSWSSVESPINSEKSKNSRSLCNFLKLQETLLLRYTKGLMKKLNLLGFFQCHDAFGDIKFNFGVYAHNLSCNEMFVKRLNNIIRLVRLDRRTPNQVSVNGLNKNYFIIIIAGCRRPQDRAWTWSISQVALHYRSWDKETNGSIVLFNK